MTAHGCWLCATPPSAQTRMILATRCTCGFELRYHGYGHPHSMAVVGCAAFLVALPLDPPRQDEQQPTLF
jgi:hypothetical protein